MDPATLLGASKEMRPSEQGDGRVVLPERCPKERAGRERITCSSPTRAAEAPPQHRGGVRAGGSGV